MTLYRWTGEPQLGTGRRGFDTLRLHWLGRARHNRPYIFHSNLGDQHEQGDLRF